MKKRNIVMVVIGLLAIVYFVMTPVGSLRLAILSSGHPISAFTFSVKEEPYTMSLQNHEIGYSLENAPVEKETDSELINWVVSKHGIFYTARYYGWG